MRSSIHGSGAREYGGLMMRTIGEIAEDPELLTAYRGQLLMPGLEQLRQVTDRARLRSEIAQDLPTDVVCSVIAGPLFLFHGTTSDDLSSQQIAIEKLLQPALTCIVNSSCEITP